MAYHSALKDELQIDGELNRWEDNRNVVFAWDVTKGIHPDFHKADAIYSEPSWRHGYSKFLKRAAQENTSQFHQYLNAITYIIDTLRKPTYIVAGKHMLKALNPKTVTDIIIHGYGGHVAVWNAEPLQANDLDELIDIVCSRHEIVLDFCCGYGNLAAKAKRFICSDINRHCVFYVAETYMGYENG